MEYVKISNWDKYQARSDRRVGPWIKLYTALPEDYEFSILSDNHKLQLMMVWVLAGRIGNLLPLDGEWMSQRVQIKTDIDVELLINKGFLYKPSAEEVELDKKAISDAKRLSDIPTSNSSTVGGDSPVINKTEVLEITAPLESKGDGEDTVLKDNKLDGEGVDPDTNIENNLDAGGEAMASFLDKKKFGDEALDERPMPEKIKEVMAYWRDQLNINKLMTNTAERNKKVRVRLNEGYTVEFLKASIRGVKHSSYHVEKGICDILIIFRNQNQMQKFAVLESQKGEGPTFGSSSVQSSAALEAEKMMQFMGGDDDFHGESSGGAFDEQDPGYGANQVVSNQ